MLGGGEVNVSGPEFPLKELSHTNINQTVCVYECVCGEEVQTARGVSWLVVRGLGR